MRYDYKKFLYTFTVLTILLLPSSLGATTKPNDVYGWDYIKWGMTDKQVQDVLGEDVRKRPAKKDKKEAMYSELELRGIKMGNKNFRASLWMGQDTRTLKRIVFVPEGEPEQYEWAETFINLEKYLVRKYGDPDVEETSNDPGTSALRVWRFPSTEIELSYLQLEDTELLLLVFSQIATQQ